MPIAEQLVDVCSALAVVVLLEPIHEEEHISGARNARVCIHVRRRQHLLVIEFAINILLLLL